MPSEASLLPCPFCGSTDLGIRRRLARTYVGCMDCFAEGPGMIATAWNGSVEVEDAARAGWNTRAKNVPEKKP